MKEKIALFMRYQRLVVPHLDRMAIIILCSALSIVFGLVAPYLTRLAIDHSLLSGDLRVFNVLMILGLLTYVYSRFIGFIQQTVGFALRNLISFELTSRFYRHMHRLPLSFFRSRPTGEHMYRIGSDLGDVSSMIIETVPSIIISTLRLTLLLAICLWLHWKLTLLVVLVTPIFYLHTHYFSKIRYRVNREMVLESQAISAGLEEALSHALLTKLFARSRAEVKRYLSGVIRRIRIAARAFRVDLASSETAGVMSTLAMAGITYYAAYQVIAGSLTLGTLSALTMYLAQLAGLLRSFGGMYGNIVARFVAVERVSEIMDIPVSVTERPRPLRVAKLRPEIALEDVTFGYLSGRPVLEALEGTVRPGEVVAIAGPSGVGKSTLLGLVLRIHDPSSGRIVVDGRDLTDLHLPSYLSQVGVALQDPMLVRGTVFDNVHLGRNYLRDEDVSQALEISGAMEFVGKLPAGPLTPIGDRGAILSYGQQQRISIARAIAAAPGLIVLDEAMSSLPGPLEMEILEKLRAGAEKTILVVSRWPGVLEAADRVLFLYNGKVAGWDRHTTLLRENTLYRNFTRLNDTDDESGKGIGHAPRMRAYG